MGIEDEKTRPALRAVKRKEAVPVAEQQTRQVKAVKRRPAGGLPEEALATAPRVHVLPRGELRNAAGSTDNGWVVRDDFEKTEHLRYVLAEEGLGATVARALLRGSRYWLDAMVGEQGRGGLVLEEVVSEYSGRRRVAPREGSGHLYDGAGARRAGFVIRPRYELVCLDARSQVVFESKRTERGARVMARRRTIATVEALTSEGLTGTQRLGVEVTFEASATPFERLCLAAGVTLHEAWMLERKNFRVGLGADALELDLGAFFGID